MRVAILTSSRADYGIYRPLIKTLNDDPFFHVSIIVFGFHLSAYHGHTIDEILEDGFNVDYKINSVLLTDDENSLSSSIGLTTLKFADFWEDHAKDFDLVFCLGDRFEMFAAVIAGLSYGIRFAHIHGGETTLGAIDNVFRHSITMASKLHFVATEAFAVKVRSLIEERNDKDSVVVSGALSLDNLGQLKLLNNNDFFAKWQIDLSIPSVLITIHPETVDADKNSSHLHEIMAALTELKNDYQLIITMPNADTYGSIYRNAFKILSKEYPEKVKAIENFGTQSYFTCMKEVKFMLGNTSSGIIEAASFNKYVINIGDRQKGRLYGENVYHVQANMAQIMEAVKSVESAKANTFKNIYYSGGAADSIIRKLKSLS